MVAYLKRRLANTLEKIIRELLTRENHFSAILLTMLKEKDRLFVAMILWSMWKSRNTKFSEAINTTPPSIATRANDVPSLGHIKCNVDTAIFNSNTTMAYGLCFRDLSRALLMGKSEYFHLSIFALEGLINSLNMAISNHLHNGNQALVDAVRVNLKSGFCRIVARRLGNVARWRFYFFRQGTGKIAARWGHIVARWCAGG
ncbi:hypothetical protein MTR_8g057090 [Medicago truncatula]|uniref:Uncharacterized protein n=1 Tax=Medicago truncatula TaxID=3880 RepID=G7LB22_MEDTR|nr:hypothetical protein MTR_8g057090 [Medicago truncatula]